MKGWPQGWDGVAAEDTGLQLENIRFAIKRWGIGAGFWGRTVDLLFPS